MHTSTAPSLTEIVFELGIYGVGLWVAWDLWRTRKRVQLMLMLVAMVFAGALEVADIRTTHGYYYARFLWMVGGEPNWFPVAIAVAWGLVLHTVMAIAERLPGAIWQRPFVAALLGVAIDLVLDPVVANTRVVSQLGLDCDNAALPHGAAHGLGFWTWCVPPQEHTLIWGIPFANFYAWGMVVLGFSAVAWILRGAFDVDGERWISAIVLALATGVSAFCLVDVSLQLYTPVVVKGVPQWLLLALVFAPGAYALLRSGPFRSDDPIRLSMWAFPPGAIAYCLVVYLLDGVAAQAGSTFFVYLVAAVLLGAAAYAWALLGRFPGLVRARPHVTPPRADLIADAPAQLVPEELERIAALRDPVLRNFMITQRYHDLSALIARCIPGANANWCTFATWASKTAGESIREEEVPPVVLAILREEQRLETLLDGVREAISGQAHVSAPDVFDVARDTIARVREQVADGNRKVYAELAPLFARFVACFGRPAGAPESSPPVIDDAAFERFMMLLRPGAAEVGGQELLRRGFPAYREAYRAADPRVRAQWMLLANGLVGLHEQTRLQSNIAAAINAPVDVVAREGLIAQLGQLLPSGLRAELEALLAPASKLALRIGRAIWQRIATAAAMHISLPYGAQIPLGEDVCVSLGESFPAELNPLTLPELRTLIARYGADHSAPGGVGALDWASLDDRMRFILDLFRATQQQTDLFEQPYSQSHRLEFEGRCAAGETPPSIRPAPPTARAAE